MVIWGWFHNLAGNTIHVSALMHSCTCAKYMYGFQGTKILSPNHAMIQGPNYILIKTPAILQTGLQKPETNQFFDLWIGIKATSATSSNILCPDGLSMVYPSAGLPLGLQRYADRSSELIQPQISHEPRNTWLRHCFPPTLQQNIGTCTHVSRLICDLCCPKNEWRMLETNRNVRSSSGVFQHISF